MSGLWWLEPGWKQTCCGMCGQNIWNSGGDPDWGLCYPCFEAHHQEQDRIKEAEQNITEQGSYDDDALPF